MGQQHTPGPWMVDDEQEDRHRLYVRHVDSGRICQCFANCLVATDSELAANARLIAAAPDLLRVAELVVSWLDEEPGAHKLCDAALAAIAKAAPSPSSPE